MKKAVDAFRSIGEVSQLVGVAPHVLRYWEAQFPLFSPVKRRDGRRYYRPDDVKLAAGLCELLREDGVSIRGAKKLMSADRGASLKARGAARLPALFGDEAPAEAAPPVEIATDIPAPKPAAAPRKRKQPAERDTLPLFAHLDSHPDSAAPRVPAAARPAANWLIRLENIGTGLGELPAAASTDAATIAQAQALLAQLRAARPAVSA